MKLTHLNLKSNPVADGKSIGSSKGPNSTLKERQIEYFSRIRDNVPKIEELDDQPITENFFEKRMKEINRRVDPVQKLETNLYFKKFRDFGIRGQVLEKLVMDDIKKIEEEAGDMELIITQVKNQTADKKASRDFQE